MKTWTRRNLIRQGAFAGVTLAGCFAACSRRKESTKKRTLRVFTWLDYLKPELLDEFGRRQGCEVIVDTFSSNEELFTALDARAVRYDVLTPSSYMVSMLRREGALMRLQIEKLPNAHFVDPNYLATSGDSKMEYSVPFEISVSGIAFAYEKHRPKVQSWRAFDEASVASRFSLLDDMREVMGAALKTTGVSVNSTKDKDLKAASEIVAGWVQKNRVMSSENYKLSLIAGEDLLAHAYNGDILAATIAGGKLDFLIPEEGAPMSCDDFCIPTTAGSPDLAHSLINYFCEPEIAAANMAWSGYRAPIPAAMPLLPVELSRSKIMFPDTGILANCESLQDLGDGINRWQTVWGDLMSLRHGLSGK